MVPVAVERADSRCRQRTPSEGLDVDVKKHTAVRVLVMRATNTSVRQSLLATWSSHFAMGQPGFCGGESKRGKQINGEALQVRAPALKKETLGG